ncbi:unnamed protein product [Lymnaea stagnalis]|uniref:MCM8 N-terminal domain-containing protein n=1 Tax=Lymnaea stagnalis TaxID=6523 RepID=A0AAV2HU11_LYMST
MDNVPPGPYLPQKVQTKLQITSPYAGWNLYFPDQMYSDHSPIVEKVQVFEKYFVSWNKLFDWDDIEQKGFFVLDYKELYADQIIKDGYVHMETELRDSPDKVLACMGLAMHQIVSHKHQQEASAVLEELGGPQHDTTNYCSPYIFPRVLNFGSPLALKNFKANCYGQ